MPVLGRILSETRTSRGLTLDEVERDTRIARRYLEALEREEFDVLPAPVYCRAFLRTYAQYLGLDPREVLRLYPEKGKETELAPLPQVTKPAPPALSPNWIVAGVMILVLLFAGVLLFRASSGGEPNVPANQGVSAAATSEPTGAGAEQQNPAAAATLTAPTSQPLVEGSPIKVPDERGATGAEAIRAIHDQGLTYVIIEVYSDNVAAGDVINQSPSPGADAKSGDTVTVTVSRGKQPE
ncbi:MAG: helix-turn-helix domain-containing protein [Dehalococcoidia bacterium]